MEVLSLLARTLMIPMEWTTIYNRSESNNSRPPRTRKWVAKLRDRCPRCRWQRISIGRETPYRNLRQGDSRRTKVL